MHIVCREETCQRVAEEKGQTFIPPFDHYDVMAGQVMLCVCAIDTTLR